MNDLSDSDLVAILNSQITNATGGNTSTINNDKATALDYYYGDESIIDAEDGESSIITREVLENVERELGQQLKVFSSGERVVQFDPVNEEDEEAANQETDYVNYIYNKENNGFKITHDWIKSALLEKLSYAKVWVEEEEETNVETYSGIDDIQLSQLIEQESGPGTTIEPIEHSSYTETVIINGATAEIPLHDIKIKITTREKKFKVQAVPGEEIGVARNHNELSLSDCPFVYHRPAGITASELIEEGFDEEKVKELPGYTRYENEVSNARDARNDSTLYDEADESTREIEVYECYIRMDYDGDGLSELRKITLSGNTILENEECDFIPFATLCPLPMPNRHEGLSYADMIMDVQDVKTVLMQQILTNLYFTNMPEREVVEDKVTIDDLLYSKSGSIKRVDEPGMIRDLTVPFTAGQSLPMLDVMDSIIERRVGSPKTLNPDVLAKTTGTAFMLNDENSNQLSEKLARIFAETGFKELFRMLHELVIKHGDKKRIIKLRNKYVEIDPTEWKHRANMSVVVGLGTGNRQQEIGQLMALADKQETNIQNGSPLVDWKNLYNTYARIIERSGLKDPSLYFTDPESEEARQKEQEKTTQQQPNPLAEAEQVKGQFAIQKTQMEVEMKGQLEQLKLQADADKQMQKARYDAELKAMQTALDDRARELDRESKEAIEIMRAEVQALIAGFKVDIGKPGIGTELNE